MFVFFGVQYLYLLTVTDATNGTFTDMNVWFCILDQLVGTYTSPMDPTVDGSEILLTTWDGARTCRK